MGDLVLFLGSSILLGALISYYVAKADFPTITGLIILGLIFAMFPFSSFAISRFSTLFEVIIEIGITLLLFETGLELAFIKCDKETVFAGIIQSFLTFAFVFLISKPIFKFSTLEAMIVSVIWMVTGSDIAIQLIKKLPIKIEKKLKLGNLVVIDDLIAEIFFFAMFPLLKFTYKMQGEVSLILGYAFFEIVISIILGIIMGFLFFKFLKTFRFIKPNVTISFSFVLLIVGISLLLHIHSIIVALISGVLFSIKSSPDLTSRIRQSLGEVDSILYTLFILFAIVSVGLPKIEVYIITGLLTLVLRFAGKFFGVFVIKKLGKLKAFSLKEILLPLLPQSILSAYFAYSSKQYFITYPGSSIFAITLTSIIIFEIVGYSGIKFFFKIPFGNKPDFKNESNN